MPQPTTRHARSVAINGPALRAIRQSLGVAVADLTAALHCDPSYFSKLETGANRRCSPLFLSQLKSALGLADHRALLACPYGEDAHDPALHFDGEVDTGALPRPELGGAPGQLVPGVVPAPRTPRHRAATR